MLTFSLEQYVLLGLLGFVAGFINAIAGGAGLLVLPVMLWLGIPPLNALATGKLQAVFGTLSSATNYWRSGYLRLRPLLPMVAIAAVASALGTFGILQFANATLARLLPFLLIAAAAYSWLSPALGDRDLPARVSARVFAPLAGAGLGLYGGFFGPCVGSLATLSFAGLRGYNLRRASASAKPVVIAANAVSVLVFCVHGQVLIPLALGMGLAQVFGAQLGSRLAIDKGAALIRPFIAFTTTLITVKLLLEAYGVL